MTKRAFCAVFMVAVIFTLSSCGPDEFDKPLSDPQKAAIDNDLIGMWHSKKNDIDYYVVFGASAETRLMEVACIGNEKGKGVDVITFDAFPTYSKDHRYLNLRMATQVTMGAIGSDKVTYSDKYLIARYAVGNNHLRLWYTSDMALHEAIKNGALKGKINGQEHTLSDSAENMLQFFNDNESYGGHTVFENFGEFTKVP